MATSDCVKEKCKGLNWLACRINCIDRWLRRRDWNANRVYGRVPGFPRARGHARWAVWLAVPVAILLVYGPTLGNRGWAAVGLALIAVAAVVLIAYFARPRYLLWLQLSVLLLVGYLVWALVSADGAIEAGRFTYQHLLIPVILILAVHILIARVLAWGLFRRYAGRLYPFLRRTELFVIPKPVPIGGWRFVRSLIGVPWLYPVQLLLFPAMAVLLIYDRGLMWLIAGVLLVLSWALLAAGDVHERLSAMLELSRRVFFVGAQMAVSVIVIGLAIGRLADFHFLSFLIESGPYGINTTVALYLFTAYLFLWFDEYWINRVLSEQVLNLFRRPSKQRPQPVAAAPSGTAPAKAPGTQQLGQVPYPIKPGAITTAVLEQGRVLQIHGAARFVVQGYYLDEAGQKQEAFQAYKRTDIIERVLNQGTTGPALRTPLWMRNLWRLVGISDILSLDTGAITQRIRFFFMSLNMVLILIVLGWTVYVQGVPDWVPLPESFFLKDYRGLPQRAELTSSLPPGTGGKVSLRESLFAAQTQGSGAQDTAVLLAVSGGGTRAALYAESVLRGLAAAGVLDRVRLISSVSGGSAASAYFAVHRPALLTGGPAEWERFSATMAAPFIQDVLEGVAEWRIVGADPKRREGVRMGELLAESFEARFDLPVGPEARIDLGSAADVALIYNTALAGEFPVEFGAPACEAVPSADCGGIEDPRARAQCCRCNRDESLAQRELACPELASGRGSGGRLVLTNLLPAREFPHTGLPEAPDEYLTYVDVRDPKVPLARAAALSANFPPVFSNAGIDLAGSKRYWVTDGGAADNRGVISLLFALRAALEQGCQKQGDDCQASGDRRRPSIHVVVAEASATDLGFSQDRGIGSKFGAPAKFASQLMLELMEEIDTTYAAMGGRFHVHYLAMPLALRSGGLGTHWILPVTAGFSRPPTVSPHGPEEIKLCGSTVRAIIDALHSYKDDPRPSTKPEPGLAERITRILARCDSDTEKAATETLWRWICDDRYLDHAGEWQRLVQALTGDAGYRHPRCTTR